jgi:probable HAF family extracellular repeat protein
MYDISALQGPNNSHSSLAFGMSAAGDAAGVAYEASGTGTIWREGNFDFSLSSGSHSILCDVNGSGDAVGVRATDNSPTQIAVIVRGHKVHDLTSAVGDGSLATGINDAGLVCGWSWNNAAAFVYDSNAQSVIHWIDPLPGKSRSVALAINAAGEVSGTSDDHGFFYNGALKDLGPAAFVSGLNDVGIVCGSLGKPYPQNFSPAIWHAKEASPSVMEIPVPPGFIGGHGEGINSKGEVVGSCWNPATYNGTQSAFIYSGGVSTDLNTLISEPGWHLEFAEDINDWGQIVGYGSTTGSRPHSS